MLHFQDLIFITLLLQEMHIKIHGSCTFLSRHVPNLTLFLNNEVISVSILIGLLLCINIALIVLIYCKPAWMVYIMGSGIRVIKKFQFWKRVAAVTKGGSLPSPPIYQTIFSINICTFKSFTTTCNLKMYIH